MKFILLFILFSFTSYSQISGEGEVYLTVETVQPKFQGGGIEKFNDFVKKEFDFSKIKGFGKIVTSFEIDEHGDVNKIKILEFFDIDAASEMVRVLKISPKWEPAKRAGKAIGVTLKFPFEFKSTQENLNEIDSKDTSKKDLGNARSDNATTSNEGSTRKVDTLLEKAPKFVGGIKTFYKFIGDNFRTPNDAKFKGGKLLISFVVEKDGSLTDFVIEKDLGFGTAQEAIRVLRSSPKWLPAEQKGIPVRCKYTLPITLRGN